jgi:hypothetical protein
VGEQTPLPLVYMLSLTRVQRPADHISKTDVYRLNDLISRSMLLADNGSSDQEVSLFCSVPKVVTVSLRFRRYSLPSHLSPIHAVSVT